jgi:ribosomal protein S18 acetylase RimI-like enzyme
MKEIINGENYIINDFGYCCFDFGKYNIFDIDKAIIYNLYVYPEYRKCGQAKKLLKETIDEIRKSNYNLDIFIEAKPRDNSISINNLINFYKSIGLRIL